MSWSCSCQMWGDCEQNSNQSRLLTLTKSHVSSVKLFISHKMWILNRSQLSWWHCTAALTALTALCRYFGYLAPCIISRDFCRWKTEGKRDIFFIFPKYFHNQQQWATRPIWSCSWYDGILLGHLTDLMQMAGQHGEHRTDWTHHGNHHQSHG